MAQIVLSDLAPDGAKHFSLGQFEIDAPHETDDARLLSEAAAHPWLHVEYDEAEVTVVEDSAAHVRPEDDPLSAEFKGDPREANAPDPEPIQPLAVQSGLDQSKPVEVGVTDVTLAAADESDPKSTDKPAKKGKENG